MEVDAFPCQQASDWCHTRYFTPRAQLYDIPAEMISRSTKRSTREVSPPPSSPPITIQVQVPGADTGTDNRCLLPQQGRTEIRLEHLITSLLSRLSLLLWRLGPQWSLQEDF